MNFLFTTVLVLLIVAPGLIFFKTYFSGELNIRHTRLTVTDQAFYSVVPAILLHLIIVWFGKITGHFYVDFEILGVLLMGAKDDLTIKMAFKLIYNDLGKLLQYQFVVCFLAGSIGWLLHLAVLRFRLDSMFDIFKFDNPWFYLAKGEEFGKEVEFVIVDILIKGKENNVLYTGLLTRFQLAADGGLDSIYIGGAKRKLVNTDPRVKVEVAKSNASDAYGRITRLLSKDAPKQETYNEYYPVDGNLLVIPYKEVININFTYYGEDTDTSDSSDAFEISV